MKKTNEYLKYSIFFVLIFLCIGYANQNNKYYGFSYNQYKKLCSCDSRLIALFAEVNKTFPCIIVCGYRNEADQNKSHNQNKSRFRYPNSKHNTVPALAIDVMPCGIYQSIDWKDRTRITYFAGFVKGIAFQMGINITWGGDWDNDTDLRDNKFNDLAHYELSNPL